jgi:hypothetical protein
MVCRAAAPLDAVAAAGSIVRTSTRSTSGGTKRLELRLNLRWLGDVSSEGKLPVLQNDAARVIKRSIVVRRASRKSTLPVRFSVPGKGMAL